MNLDSKEFISNIVNKEFIEFVFDNSTDVFWIIDRNFDLIYISPSIELITGYTKEEFMKLSRLEKYSESTFIKLNNLFSQVTDNQVTNNKFQDVHLEYISKSGYIVNVDVKGEIIYDEDGLFCGIYGLSKMNSKERELHNELLLEKERNVLARQFTSTILGLVGHEFITPLNGILGFTKILSQNANSDDEYEMLNDINHSAQRLNASLNSLLTLAAIESNQINIENNEVDLIEILNNLRNTFLPVVEFKKIEFDININENIARNFITDENCLYHILYQLIDNAIKYTDEGKVQILVNDVLYKNRCYLELSIHDSGIGISNNKYDTIFEPFRQISEGHDRHYEGLGLGLSIAKKLVDKLDGDIKVDSIIGKGSVFKVVLPKEYLINY